MALHHTPLVKIATCNLNQWNMDFKGNLKRIVESIKQAKAMQCTFRTGYVDSIVLCATCSVKCQGFQIFFDLVVVFWASFWSTVCRVINLQYITVLNWRLLVMGARTAFLITIRSTILE